MAIYLDEQGIYRGKKGLDTNVYEYFKNRDFRFGSEVITSYTWIRELNSRRIKKNVEKTRR